MTTQKSLQKATFDMFSKCCELKITVVELQSSGFNKILEIIFNFNLRHQRILLNFFLILYQLSMMSSYFINKLFYFIEIKIIHENVNSLLDYVRNGSTPN